MKQENKDTVNISLVALILVLVGIGAVTCTVLLSIPFLVNWIVSIILLVVI